MISQRVIDLFTWNGVFKNLPKIYIGWYHLSLLWYPRIIICFRADHMLFFFLISAPELWVTFRTLFLMSTHIFHFVDEIRKIEYTPHISLSSPWNAYPSQPHFRYGKPEIEWVLFIRPFRKKKRRCTFMTGLALLVNIPWNGISRNID